MTAQVDLNRIAPLYRAAGTSSCAGPAAGLKWSFKPSASTTFNTVAKLGLPSDDSALTYRSLAAAYVDWRLANDSAS